MIEWSKAELGEYKSKDGRFCINKYSDAMWGTKWVLRDLSESNYYHSLYAKTSLKACKLLAESLVNKEIEEQKVC